MLSHPANDPPEEAAVATATSQMPPASGNRRRHLTVADVLGHFDREFFRSWFIDGPKLLLQGRFSAREGAFMAVAALPAIIATLFLTLPGLVFDSPDHHAFFHFARNLQQEAVSALPLVLGALCSLFSLRFPLAQ
jgi:hypothetical protein